MFFVLGIGASSGSLACSQSGIGALGHLTPLMRVPPHEVPIFGSVEKETFPPRSSWGRPWGTHPLSWGLSSISTSSSFFRLPHSLGMEPVNWFSSMSISIRFGMQAIHTGSSPIKLFESRSISAKLAKYLSSSGIGPSSPRSGRWKLVIFLQLPLAAFCPDQWHHSSSQIQSPLHSRPSQFPWYPWLPHGSSAHVKHDSPAPYQLFSALCHLADLLAFFSLNRMAARMSSSHVGAYCGYAKTC
mmetsp:Transcript_1667/g.3714  ORF Transcript_1667/g.3714 Transcript_1667/m.3714 type:complete len:243 (-) Transcript_1667:434-1162(-)